VSSNYQFDLAPRTWDLIRTMRSGTAVFMMPSGPIKCAGAPQKIDDFVSLMRPLGLVEVSRTGVAAISRGPDPI